MFAFVLLIDLLIDLIDFLTFSAVQEERMAAARDKSDFEAESTSSSLLINANISVESLRNAELASEPRFDSYVDAKDDPIGTFCHAAEKQLFTLVDWAKCIPYFVDLPIEDQVTLLRSGWLNFKILPLC